MVLKGRIKKRGSIWRTLQHWKLRSKLERVPLGKNFFNRKTLKALDWVLICIVVAIVCFGILAITNATAGVFSGEEETIGEFIQKLDLNSPMWQMIFFGAGVVLIIVVLMIDYNNLRDFADIIYWVSVALLLAVLVLGSNQRGATGWFMFGSRGFQPSEVAKIAIIIALAKVLAQKTEGHENGIRAFRDLIPVLWRFAIPFALIVWQNDWGTALVYVFILFGMMFMAKVKLRYMAYILLVGIAMIPLIWLVMDDWRKNRILTFLNPELDPENAGYNVNQAKIAIGSGGFNGKGFFAAGALSQLDYIPEAHTDFIFSVTSEAIGFIGGLILILLYFFLIMRMIQLSTRAKDDFGSYIIIGVACMLLFHIFENIGMNMGIMPVTGIPLPMFSYGGSNLVTTMIAIGLVLNVNMQKNRTPF